MTVFLRYVNFSRISGLGERGLVHLGKSKSARGYSSRHSFLKFHLSPITTLIRVQGLLNPGKV